MEIRTFTNFWNMEKKLYSIYDVSLPMPISLKVVGAFLLTGVPWWGLLVLLNVPFGDFFILWILPPVALGYIASKPIFQKKTLTEFLMSQFRYLRQPKRMAGFRTLDYSYDSKYKFVTKVFRRKKEN